MPLSLRPQRLSRAQRLCADGTPDPNINWVRFGHHPQVIAQGESKISSDRVGGGC